MMNFRVIKQALLTTLGTNANGNFRVFGFQSQGQAATEIKENLATVQVYYSHGDFPKSSGRYTGSTQHQIKMTIGLTVSAPSRINLSVINNPAATNSQIVAAMSAMQEADEVADDLFDALAENVYNIVMNAMNVDLGLPVGTIASRWIERIAKDPPLPKGELVVLTGEIQYSCNTVERPGGDTPILMTSPGGITTDLAISTDIDTQIMDPVEKTGVTV